MRIESLRSVAAVAIAVGIVTLTGCSNDDPAGSNNTSGGGADIDVTSSTPSSGDTNISGTGVLVQTGSDTLNGVPVTSVQLDATSGGNLRRVRVYFDTATGNPEAVSYFWGAANVNENIVYCPAAGCTGVTVNQGTKEIFFSNTALDDNNPVGPTTKFATLSVGAIQYP